MKTCDIMKLILFSIMVTTVNACYVTLSLTLSVFVYSALWICRISIMGPNHPMGVETGFPGRVCREMKFTDDTSRHSNIRKSSFQPPTYHASQMYFFHPSYILNRTLDPIYNSQYVHQINECSIHKDRKQRRILQYNFPGVDSVLNVQIYRNKWIFYHNIQRSDNKSRLPLNKVTLLNKVKYPTVKTSIPDGWHLWHPRSNSITLTTDNVFANIS